MRVPCSKKRCGMYDIVRSIVTVTVGGMVFAGISLRGDAIKEEQQNAYRNLRKEFIVAMAVTAAPAGSRMRKEHRRFLKGINEFLETIGDSAPLYAASATYFRGRLAMKVHEPAYARKDLDAVLKTLEEADADPVDLPGGMPSITAVRIFRAFTFVGDGHGRVMEELDTIPEGAPKPAYHEVGSLLNNWADALADNDQDDLALRAYTLIHALELWEEEADNPKRKIDLIKLKQNGGMLIRTNDAE